MLFLSILFNNTYKGQVAVFLVVIQSPADNELVRNLESDIISIHDPDIDGLAILEKRHAPIESCRYCNPSDTFVYPWDTAPKGKAKPEDWVYKSYRNRIVFI